MKRLLLLVIFAVGFLVGMLLADSLSQAHAAPRLFMPGPCAGGQCAVEVQAVIEVPHQVAKKVPPAPPAVAISKPASSGEAIGNSASNGSRRVGGTLEKVVAKVKAVFRRQ